MVSLGKHWSIQNNWPLFSKIGQTHKSETFGEFMAGNRKSKAKLLPSNEPAKFSLTWVSLKVFKPWFLRLYWGLLVQVF